MSLLSRLKTQSQVLAEYNSILEWQEHLGIIETMPDTEIAAEVGEVHYLPHRAVICKDKQTTRLRIVYERLLEVTAALHSIKFYMQVLHCYH